MLKSYQSIYVTVYRWSFKNFGQGELPRFKSLFNVSFLLIIVLTNLMLLTQVILRTQLFLLNSYAVGTVMLLSTVFFLLLSHLVFLNNKWLKKLNVNMAHLSRHNLNTWSVVVLVNVIIICGFVLFTTR
ncbi:MAG: hypothetical protein JWP37_4365 [Mucilaginibacter sp.]|jgi:hypothetical protein|nr:hypothetical protein [Mucilaginibacter sp.]